MLCKSGVPSVITIPLAGKSDEIIPPEQPAHATTFTVRVDVLFEIQPLAVIPENGAPTAIEAESSVPRYPTECMVNVATLPPKMKLASEVATIF